MALGWSKHLKSAAVVYDCMDELAAFKGALVEFVQAAMQRVIRIEREFTLEVVRLIESGCVSG